MKFRILQIGCVTLMILLSCGAPKQGPSGNSVNSLLDNYWKLIELNGKTIDSSNQGNREPHMIFKAMDNKVSGNGGCNSFFGTFELSENFRLSFSNIGATKMACPDMSTEAELFNVLSNIDNFTIKDDTLSLNKARMAPLAKFIRTTDK